jgi:8-oxo-dGTP diphosphatase
MSTPHEVTVAGFDWIHWEPVDRAVLLFLFRGREVLLIHKKRGLGKGKINGPGGRLEPGESFAQAAIRETLEETGVSVSDLEEVAELSFVFVDGHSIYARVFFCLRVYWGAHGDR